MYERITRDSDQNWACLFYYYILVVKLEEILKKVPN